MLKYILFGLLAIVAILLIVIATRPDDFRVTRSGTFSVSPTVLFNQINNLQNWNAWSPWARLDPNAKNTFEGPKEGVGASFAWAGNAQVGEGKMTIVEGRPDEQIVMRLDFVKPFAGTNIAEFTLRPEGGQTVLTWSMHGKTNFITKGIGLFMDCEKMCGDQFEQGLANLRQIVEQPKAITER